MSLYESVWRYILVYESVKMNMSQYDGIWKYMMVYECKW